MNVFIFFNEGERERVLFLSTERKRIQFLVNVREHGR